MMLLIKKLSNQDRYNEIDIDRSEVFLDNLPSFVHRIGIDDFAGGEFEMNGIVYDHDTYRVLFEDGKRLSIDELNGTIIRYANSSIELLILFFNTKTTLVFYCSQESREKIMNSLLEFCEIMK